MIRACDTSYCLVYANIHIDFNHTINRVKKETRQIVFQGQQSFIATGFQAVLLLLNFSWVGKVERQILSIAKVRVINLQNYTFMNKLKRQLVGVICVRFWESG
jgi:hypothetical protein